VTKKVLVTGSRDFDDGQTVMDAIWAEQVEGERLLVINGGARGADTMANTVATRLPNMLSVTVPADWDNDGRYAAGPIRNRAMLDLAPDVVLAFYKEGARNVGTQDCVNAATERGIPVKVFHK